MGKIIFAKSEWTVLKLFQLSKSDFIIFVACHKLQTLCLGGNSRFELRAGCPNLGHTNLCYLNIGLFCSRVSRVPFRSQLSITDLHTNTSSTTTSKLEILFILLYKVSFYVRGPMEVYSRTAQSREYAIFRIKCYQYIEI